MPRSLILLYQRSLGGRLEAILIIVLDAIHAVFIASKFIAPSLETLDEKFVIAKANDVKSLPNVPRSVILLYQRSLGGRLAAILAIFSPASAAFVIASVSIAFSPVTAFEKLDIASPKVKSWAENDSILPSPKSTLVNPSFIPELDNIAIASASDCIPLTASIGKLTSPSKNPLPFFIKLLKSVPKLGNDLPIDNILANILDQPEPLSDPITFANIIALDTELSFILFKPSKNSFIVFINSDRSSPIRGNAEVIPDAIPPTKFPRASPNIPIISAPFFIAGSTHSNLFANAPNETTRAAKATINTAKTPIPANAGTAANPTNVHMPKQTDIVKSNFEIASTCDIAFFPLTSLINHNIKANSPTTNPITARAPIALKASLVIGPINPHTAKQPVIVISNAETPSTWFIAFFPSTSLINHNIKANSPTTNPITARAPIHL